MTLSLPSRSLRGYGAGILAGVISAGIFAYALTLQSQMGFVLINIMGAVPLFLAGLGMGAEVGALASVTAFALIVGSRSFNLGIFYMAIFGLPTALLSYLALQHGQDKDGKDAWYPEGKLVAVLTLYPAFAFVTGHVAALASGYKDGLLGMTLQGMKAWADTLKTHATNPERLQDFVNLLNTIAHMLPALVGCGWIMVILLSIFVSQTTLQQQNWNIRPDFKIMAVSVTPWLFAALVLTVAAGFVAPPPYNYLGGNLGALLTVPYFFQGLAVVHAKANASLFRLWIFWIYYIFLLFPFQWTILLTFTFTLLLGVSDLLFNFRARIAAAQLKLKIRGVK